MTLPFTLPDWLPWWVPIVLLIPCLLYGLAVLVMPFAVLGVKSRLDAIELRLDEIQGEIRSLSLRMQEPAQPRRGANELYADPPAPPPIPPAPRAAPTDRRAGSTRDERAEPRLNWPR